MLIFFPLLFFHSCVAFVVLGKFNANSDHLDHVPSIFSFTKLDTVKNIQKFRRFSNLQNKNTEKSTHSEEVPKKVILCSSAENKIKVEPVVLSLTSQKPPENFDFNVSCSLTDDTTKTPTKPQQKLIESSKENSLKKVSMVASTSHNTSLLNASSTSQTIKVSNNLSLISNTPIKTNIDINNENCESSTLHSMNYIEIDFLRKEKIDIPFRIQCLEEKLIEIEILYYVPFAMTLKYYYRVF